MVYLGGCRFFMWLNGGEVQRVGYVGKDFKEIGFYVCRKDVE